MYEGKLWRPQLHHLVDFAKILLTCIRANWRRTFPRSSLQIWLRDNQIKPVRTWKSRSRIVTSFYSSTWIQVSSFLISRILFGLLFVSRTTLAWLGRYNFWRHVTPILFLSFERFRYAFERGELHELFCLALFSSAATLYCWRILPKSVIFAFISNNLEV